MHSPLMILIDQDGPLADYHGAVRSILDEAGYDSEKYDYTGNTIKDVKRIFGLSASEMVSRARLQEGFYRNLKPVAGAIEAIEKLQIANHRIIVCSSPLENSRFCASEKLLWLREWFPLLTNSFALTMDKTIVTGDILIDDKILIVGSNQPTWRHIWFSSASFSQSSMTGIKDWSQLWIVENLIEKIIKD